MINCSYQIKYHNCEDIISFVIIINNTKRKILEYYVLYTVGMLMITCNFNINIFIVTILSFVQKYSYFYTHLYKSYVVAKLTIFISQLLT